MNKMKDKDREATIEDFFRNRDSLIEALAQGEIGKREFLDGNYQYIVNNNIKPFEIIDSFEKGMYNYQYYNVMAKYYKSLISEMKTEKKTSSFYGKYMEDMKYYYDEKDKVSFRLLKHIKYKNVEAYYIDVNSNNLKNKLFEIVLKDYKYAVLHSMAQWLLNALIKEQVFDSNCRKSVIDDYVNKDY